MSPVCVRKAASLLGRSWTQERETMVAGPSNKTPEPDWTWNFKGNKNLRGEGLCGLKGLSITTRIGEVSGTPWGGGGVPQEVSFLQGLLTG